MLFYSNVDFFYDFSNKQVENQYNRQVWLVQSKLPVNQLEERRQGSNWQLRWQENQWALFRAIIKFQLILLSVESKYTCSALRSNKINTDLHRHTYAQFVLE